MPYIFLIGANFIAEGEETRKGNKKVFDHLLRDESHDLWKRSFIARARAEQVLGSILNRGSDYPEPPVYHIQFIPHHITSKSRTARTSC